MEDVIYFNTKTGRIVPENYPDAVKYVRSEETREPKLGDILVDDDGYMCTVCECVGKNEDGNVVINTYNLVSTITGRAVNDVHPQLKNLRLASYDEKERYFEIVRSVSKGGRNVD